MKATLAGIVKVNADAVHPVKPPYSGFCGVAERFVPNVQSAALLPIIRLQAKPSNIVYIMQIVTKIMPR